MLLIAASSCAQPPRRVAPVRSVAGAGPGPEAAGVAPAWATAPHSWGKLDAIERWISEQPQAPQYWRNESRLQLAEGQLKFALQGAIGGASPEVLAYRRSSALTGFESVRADASATKDQQQRAMRGAKSANQALAATPAAATIPAPVKGMIPRARWSAIRPNPRELTPTSSSWRWITVHHSVFSAASNDVESSLDTVRRIQREHMNGRNYGDVGYHFFIDRAGRVIEGRSLKWRGAHSGGSNNKGNVGICLLGNFDEERPSTAAIATLDRLVYEIQNVLKIPRKNVRPHKAWKETECPGEHLMPWFARR